MAVITITLNPCIDKAFAVERMVPDRKLTGQELREYPGGGGINVARAVTRLGGRAHALWSAGGNTGERLAQLLDAEHVPHTPIPISGEVRENLIVRGPETVFRTSSQAQMKSQLRACSKGNEPVGSPLDRAHDDSFREIPLHERIDDERRNHRHHDNRHLHRQSGRIGGNTG